MTGFRLGVNYIDYALGFMKLGFEWSEVDTAPFFPGILPNLSFPQVSSSYDIGKWWGHP